MPNPTAIANPKTRYRNTTRFSSPWRQRPQPATADAAPLAQVRPAPDGDGWEYAPQPYLFVPLSIQSTVNVETFP
ncbi:MAG TPA: hypothetical protein VLS96_07495 [Nodosilinea sp.]|nr:hypothetical protein [Nodosilinea sp.]